jgi:protein-disulfide isomerase
MSRVDSGSALAQRIGVRGTPTLIVNGWRFSAPPSEEELGKAVSKLLVGEKPF